MDTNKSTVNDYFDRVFVLNLEKRTDRKAAMVQKLEKLQIEAEFFPAVNGYNFQNRLEYLAYLQKPLGADNHDREVFLGRKLIGSCGAWGCLKSYLNILEDAKRKSYRRILCLEDDAVFHKDFENQFQKAIQTIPTNWKMLYLGAIQLRWDVPGALCYPDKNKEEVDPDAPYYLSKITLGTCAIAFHHTVYDLLIQEILKTDSPIDYGPVRAVNEAYPEHCLVLNPNLVIADVSDSNIRDALSREEEAKVRRWDLSLYDFSFQTSQHPLPEPSRQPVASMQISNYRQHRNILLEKQNAVFFIIPKTGCTSIKTQLVEPLGMEKKDDIVSFIHEPEHYPFPFAPYDELNSTYRDYFKFAFVRNPWDRLVSCYKDKIKAAGHNAPGYSNGVAATLQRFGVFHGGMTFEAFAQAVCGISDAVADIHFRSQMFQLLNPQGELLVNYIGRFENLQASIADINQATGLAFDADVHLNKTATGKHFTAYYHGDLAEKVGKRYELDVNLLKYSFDNFNVKPIGKICPDWQAYFSRDNLLFSIMEEKNRASSLELHKLKNMLRYMQQSLSWKLTAPLRGVKGWWNHNMR